MKPYSLSTPFALAGLFFALVISTVTSARAADQNVALAPASADYAYPIANPLQATVVGTPNGHKAKFKVQPEFSERTAKIFPKRKIPEIFWYLDGLPYAVASQKKPAPLMFVIGGTGSGHLSVNMLSLGATYFEAGYHVVLMSSPTYAAFIVTASKHQIPGRVATDVEDLTMAMSKIKQDLAADLKITGTAVSGFSLGGLHALFIAERDSRKPVLGLTKAIAINPPVNLISSIRKVDRLLAENLPGGMNKAQAFYEDVFGRVAKFYSTTERLDFSDDFLYRLQRDQPFDDPHLASLIGVSFRISLANMLFTSDVMANSGFLKPKGFELSPAHPLRHYFQAAVRFSFEEYLDEYLLPYFAKANGGMTKKALTDEAGLKSIETFLRSSPKVHVVSNADDIILKPGDTAYLSKIFGARSQIFPKGGHLGNLDEKSMVAHLIKTARQ